MSERETLCDHCGHMLWGPECRANAEKEIKESQALAAEKQRADRAVATVQSKHEELGKQMFRAEDAERALAEVEKELRSVKDNRVEIINHAAESAQVLIRERDEARRECEEQARLNGMGAEREAALLAKIERMKKDCAWTQEVEAKNATLTARLQAQGEALRALDSAMLNHSCDDRLLKLNKEANWYDLHKQAQAALSATPVYKDVNTPSVDWKAEYEVAEAEFQEQIKLYKAMVEDRDKFKAKLSAAEARVKEYETMVIPERIKELEAALANQCQPGTSCEFAKRLLSAEVALAEEKEKTAVYRHVPDAQMGECDCYHCTLKRLEAAERANAALEAREVEYLDKTHKLEQANAGLREALEFYANRDEHHAYLGFDTASGSRYLKDKYHDAARVALNQNPPAPQKPGCDACDGVGIVRWEAGKDCDSCPSVELPCPEHGPYPPQKPEGER